jgi:hypothetical protein
MWFLNVAGAVALISGILFLFSPKALHQLSNKVNAVINKMCGPIDEDAYKLRTGLGVSLLLVAGMLFFVAYFVTKKYGA